MAACRGTSCIFAIILWNAVFNRLASVSFSILNEWLQYLVWDFQGEDALRRGCAHEVWRQGFARKQTERLEQIFDLHCHAAGLLTPDPLMHRLNAFPKHLMACRPMHSWRRGHAAANRQNSPAALQVILQLLPAPSVRLLLLVERAAV